MKLQTSPSKIKVVQDNGPSNKTEDIHRTNKQRSRISVVLMTLLMIIVVGVLAFAFIDSAAKNRSVEDVEKKHAMKHGICLERCTNHKTHLLDRTHLLEVVEKGKDRLIEKLKMDYGSNYFDAIFLNQGNNDTAYRPFVSITPDGESKKRLKRKLMMKVLSMQTSVLTHEKEVSGCDCAVGSERSLDEESSSTLEGSSNKSSSEIRKTFFERYVWATGGHSASAGHGNLFNESYTAYMERDVKEIFGSIGIYFEGRNHAMGGIASGPEVSMCWEQVFGDDVDFFSWDYGMTDGWAPQLIGHFGYRGAISSGHPAFLALHVGEHQKTGMQYLESFGVSVFYQDNARVDAMNDGVPESAGISKEEISKLPEYVRNLKCSGTIEKGDPYCDEEKYSKAICFPRKFMAPWHPGFKAQAMEGHGMALFLVEALLGALTDLTKHNNTDPYTLLSELKTQELDLDEKIKRADIPSDLTDPFYWPGKDKEKDPLLDVMLLWQGKSLCRTGMLPAMSRYLGYTTNTDKVGYISPKGEELYDIGVNPSEMMDGLVKLVYENDREDCPVVVAPDHKDYFYIHTKHGPLKLTVPNEKEKTAYNYNPSDFKGLIVLYFQTCDWARCPEGYLKRSGASDGNFTITVNNKPVTEVLPFGRVGSVLKGDGGVYWHPNESGDYDLMFEVKAAESFLRITSVVLY